ncbi:MAG TPA: DNA repair protein RecN [Alphaproteobacteria bacterium]
MLRQLAIRDVVLIDTLDIEGSEGLSALTGETGAGKSILLDALGLALGFRAETGLVRKGADQASVTAVFDLPRSHPVFLVLREHEIRADDGTLILRRVLSSEGKSKAFINDQPVGVGLLKIAGDLIVDIHSQFETHGLMDAKTHIYTLDLFAGAEKQHAQVAGSHALWKDLRDERDALIAKIEQARRDQDYWQTAYDDLLAINPKDNEEEILLERRVMLAAREQLSEAFAEVQNLADGEGGAIQNLNRAWKILDRITQKAGERLNPVLESFDRAMNDLRAGLDTLETWFDTEGAGPDTLSAVDDRLQDLRAQARKHQVQVANLPAILTDIGERLSAIRGDDGKLAKLDHAVEQAKSDYQTAARKLSDIRQKAAKQLDKQIMAELPPLKLDKARFETQITQLPEHLWNENGMDAVQFVVATNPGSAPGPIDKIASGGELSRFMLAIKVVLAATSPVSVLVFDEVDSGIGGATADAVGERLARLSKSGRQVLVVTHSPQVAARAGHHWVVTKAANDGGKTVRTTLLPMTTPTARTEEIARMISGASVTPEALAAAGKLLQQAS